MSDSHFGNLDFAQINRNPNQTFATREKYDNKSQFSHMLCSMRIHFCQPSTANTSSMKTRQHREMFDSFNVSIEKIHVYMLENGENNFHYFHWFSDLSTKHSKPSDIEMFDSFSLTIGCVPVYMPDN